MSPAYTPFVNGESPAHTAINQRLNELETSINSATSGMPIGSVVTSGTSSVPTGWLECDGAAISRTTYASLFAAIGTTHGSGDGLTTFNLPDLRGRTVIGTGTGPSLTARTLGQILGEENHQLTIPEMRAHTHTVQLTSVPNFAAGAAPGGVNIISNTGSTGNDTPHNNMQPSIGVKYIMKVQ